MRVLLQERLAAALSGVLADAVQDFVLRRTVKTADRVRGTFVEAVEEYRGRGLCRLLWSAVERNALGIPATDGKAVVLQSECAVAPRQDDVLDFGDGACRIVEVRQDPVGAVWTVQYRRV